MIKRIISTILTVSLFFTSSCTGISKTFPSPLLFHGVKLAKSLKAGTAAKTFVRPRFQRSTTSGNLNPSMKAYHDSDFEPLAPEEKKGAIIVAVILVLLIAASIAVPIITLTQM
jgi:hypothetical protein